jgi:hypothetical protein
MGTELMKLKNETMRVPALAHLTEALTVRGEELQRGDLRLIAAKVKMTPDDYTSIGGGYDGKPGRNLLSPAGADKLNRIAGIQVVELANPMYRCDEQDAEGFTVCTRSAVALGYDALGRRCMAGPMTVSFRPRAYLLHALVKLAKQWRPKNGGEAQPAPVVYDLDGNKPERDGAWKRFRVDSEISIWVDMTNDKVGSALDTYAQDRKFADRRCMGTLRRNLLCAHPGGFPKNPGPEVMVLAWQPQRTSEDAEIEQLAQEIAQAENPRSVLPPETRIVDVTPGEPDLDEVDHGDADDDRDATPAPTPDF